MYSFRTVACPTVPNFPYDMVAETTIGALGPWAPAKRRAILLLTLIGFLIACSTLARSQRSKSYLVMCSNAVLHVFSQYSNAGLARGKIDVGERHEEARIGSTS
jgi:hypothetical protein